MRSNFPATRTAAATSGALCESAPKHTSTVWLINVNAHFMHRNIRQLFNSICSQLGGELFHYKPIVHKPFIPLWLM